MRSCFLSCFIEFYSAVAERKSNTSQLIRGRDGHLSFQISPKNKILVEEVEILLLVNFCRLLFSGCREEVENVSANQSPGWPRLVRKTQHGRGYRDLALCQVLFKSVQPLKRRSCKCLNQSEARAAILFSDQPEKYKLGR